MYSKPTISINLSKTSFLNSKFLIDLNFKNNSFEIIFSLIDIRFSSALINDLAFIYNLDIDEIKNIILSSLH